MIRFKYKPNIQILQLIGETVHDSSGPDNEGFIYGILEEESKHQLSRLALFLVCSTTDASGYRMYSDPTAVVAKNDYDAVRIFAEDMDKPGSVMCMLEEFANKISVKPI